MSLSGHPQLRVPQPRPWAEAPTDTLQPAAPTRQFHIQTVAAASSQSSFYVRAIRGLSSASAISQSLLTPELELDNRDLPANRGAVRRRR